MLTAFNKGVDTALEACRQAQMKKQLEVLELGLRGLRADLKKFSHIPEIASQIEVTINSVTSAMGLLKGDNLPEMYLEDNIDVEQRHKAETPLEFSLKQQINQVYKQRYLPLIQVYTAEKDSNLNELEDERVADLQKAESEHTKALKKINIHRVSDEVIEALDAQWQSTARKINHKHDGYKQDALLKLKNKHKAQLDAAKPIYDAEIVPLVKQLQVEIASKLFNVSIRELKRIFDDDHVQGLSLDVNSLTFYAMLSQSLDNLGKLDIVSSIGLPAIKDIVQKQIPIEDRNKTASSISDRILSNLAQNAGNSAGAVIGGIVDGPYRRLEDAVEISEQNAALVIPEANIDMPFMAYHVSISSQPTSKDSTEAVPTNFFQAIDAVSRANGVVGKLGALKGFYQAMTSGSAEGCLDDSENVFDSMNQGLICELMRQRYNILHHVGDALSKMGEIPGDWQEFASTLSEVERQKVELDVHFSKLNATYSTFKDDFDLTKREYDESIRAYEAEKINHSGSGYVQLENEKARKLIAQVSKIKEKLDGKYRSNLRSKIVKAQNKRYGEIHGQFEQATTRDKKISEYFETNPNPDLLKKIEEITIEHQKKLNELANQEVQLAQKRLDKEYAASIEKARSKLDKLQALETVCKSNRNKMAEKSREFYKAAQQFKGNREEFNQNVNFALGKIEKLNIPNGGQHLWQLQTLTNWSVDELAPLDVVISLLSTIGDKIKASAVSYSDVFDLASSEHKRKMKAETARGAEASASDKVKQSVGNMMGSSIVELKAGEQLGYLRSFADNIESTIATENRVAEVVKGYEESNLSVKHATLMDTPPPLPAETKGRLAKFFADLASFFESLNPFGPKADIKEDVNASPAIIHAAKVAAASKVPVATTKAEAQAAGHKDKTDQEQSKQRKKGTS
jgi:hypothetical protein